MSAVVFFDLDDTLFDHSWSMHRSIDALREAFPAIGAMPFGAVERKYSEALEELHVEVLAGTLSIEAARRQRLVRILEAAGESADSRQVRRAVEVQRESYQLSRRAVPGSVALLQALRGSVRVGIVTNNVREEQVEKLAVCGLSPWVDDMITSGELGVSKPDPTIFQVALRRLETDAARSVMVGDSWHSDIEGARGVGMRAVWSNRGHPRRNDEAVPELDAWEPVDACADLLVRLAVG